MTHAATRMRLLGYQIYRRSTDIQALARLSRKLVHCVRSGGSVLVSPPCAIVDILRLEADVLRSYAGVPCWPEEEVGSLAAGESASFCRHMPKSTGPPPRVSVPSW